MRENPIEPDPNPKTRLLMKSASSAANGSGQQRVRRSAADAERSTTWSSDGALAVNTRRRLAEKSAPEAITTQERIDGYRGQAMKIASVEQVELGNIMELSITGHVLTWARQLNFSGRTVAEQQMDGI